MRPLLVLLAATLASAMFAAGPPPLAIQALERMNAFDEGSWSYTRTTRTREGIRVERHDAARRAGERWSLVAIDGRTPSADETQDYQREKAKERERQKGRADYTQEIDRNSIRLISETPERATFTFRPGSNGRGGKELARKVEGTMVVRKDGGWIERFELGAEEEVRPMPGVKISDFSLILRFSRHPSSGDIVPHELESRIRGRAFFVKSIDAERTSSFSDFHKVR
jgi:hypothetical protein